jgi:hypothetical protein
VVIVDERLGEKLCSLILNVIDLSTTTPLFSKEGLGEILQNAGKSPYIPLYERGT